MLQAMELQRVRNDLVIEQQFSPKTLACLPHNDVGFSGPFSKPHGRWLNADCVEWDSVFGSNATW